MRRIGLVVGLAALVAGVAGVSPAEAAYKKVETYDWLEAGTVANNCFSFPCSSISVIVANYEDEAPSKVAWIRYYEWSDPNTRQLVLSGRTSSNTFALAFGKQRKTATFSGLVDLAEAPCDDETGCTGPVHSYALDVYIAATKTKAKNVNVTPVNTISCKLVIKGTNNFRLGSTSTVELGGVTMTAAAPFLDPFVLPGNAVFSSFTRKATWTRTTTRGPDCGSALVAPSRTFTRSASSVGGGTPAGAVPGKRRSYPHVLATPIPSV